MYDPRELANLLVAREPELRREGETANEDGTLVYWFVATDGRRYGLTGSDLEDLHLQGKLNLRGILEHDEKLRKGR
jgi:hypothetical protein